MSKIDKCWWKVFAIWAEKKKTKLEEIQKFWFWLQIHQKSVLGNFSQL